MVRTDRLIRAVKGLISRVGMVSICPLLRQRDVKLPTNPNILIAVRVMCPGELMVRTDRCTSNVSRGAYGTY